MNTQSIQNLFQNRYEKTQWKSFLAEIFKNSMFFREPETLIGIDKNIASSAFKLGYIIFNENGTERHIAVFEVVTAQNIILERNRVGLRNLLKKFWNDFDAAFIVYHKPNENKWRFTFVSEIREFNAQGDYVQSSTEPKRYTYLLGEGETIKTAAQRFIAVAEKGSQISLADIKDAFSVEKLSKEFFTEYKKHYDIFCNYCLDKPNISQAIFNGNEKAIRDFNKKLLGRIVFLFFIQKKGWLGVQENKDWGKGDLNFLNNLINNHKHSSTFYTLTLSKLFFDTLNNVRAGDLVEFDDYPKCRIPYLNGGLFEEENTNFRNISFDGSLFKNLFEFFAKYNFTIYEDDPLDHTVAVDPEMLGHIFENLLEDNKDKGAFYTPKEIVHYMCQESLIEYLAGWFEQKGYDIIDNSSFDKRKQNELFNVNEARKGQQFLEFKKQEKNEIDRSLIEKLLKKKLDDTDKELVCKHANEFNLALDNVKICDPAIGSGAFAMGLLHEIFTAKQTIHFFKYGDTKNFDASIVKLNIIQNSIYGVDIEKGAVDIARLRFWLSLIVDENQPKPLPNLDFKIVCGNSLVSKLDDDIIEIDWELENKDENLLNEKIYDKKKNILSAIHKKHKEYFNSECNKKSLANEIRNLKIDLLINQLEIMISNKGIEKPPVYNDKKFKDINEKYLQTIGWKKQIDTLKKIKAEQNATLEFFDWKLNFPEVMNENIAYPTGFDIVIGNPPYVRADNPEIATLRKVLLNSGNYKTLWEKWDLYVSFLERGFQLLKQKGIITFIIPDAFIASKYAQKPHKYFLENACINRINFLSEVKVFEAAVKNMIIEICNKKDENHIPKRIVHKDTFDNMKVLIPKKQIELSEKTFKPENEEQEFGNRNNCKCWGEICFVSVGLVLQAEENKYKGEFIKEDLISEFKDNIHIRRYIEAKNIKSYLLEKVKYLEWDTDRVPAKIRRPTFPELYIFPKIMLGGMTGGIYDSTGLLSNHSITISVLWKDLKQVNNLSINNSIRKDFAVKGDKDKLLKFRKELEHNSEEFNLKYMLAILNSKLGYYFLNSVRRSQIGFYPDDLKKIPIKKIEKTEQSNFSDKVNQILSAKERGDDTCDLEREIDAMVYKLYELTAEEIAIVEGR